MLREALTGRPAPGAGLSGELGRPRPVPGFCRAPFHLRTARAQRVEPALAVQCCRSPAGVSAAPARACWFSSRRSPAPGRAAGPRGCPGSCSVPFPFPTCLWQWPMCGKVTAASASTDVPPVVTCGNKEPSVVQLLQGEKSEVPETVGKQAVVFIRNRVCGTGSI